MNDVTVVGFGNIGSAIAPLVARMPDVTGVTLVDPQRYEHANLLTQSIDAAALGRPKVEVQAERIRAINPDIRVRTIEASVGDVPLWSLDARVLLACVDSRGARQAVNRIAWRLGRPWIDAAVDAVSLTRVTSYVPADGAPCLECGWHEGSYALLEQEYACNDPREAVPATGAPAELGALAASLQASRLRRLLTGGIHDVREIAGVQQMLDTDSLSQHVHRFQYNEACLFDHRTWSPDFLPLEPERHTLDDLFDALGGAGDRSVGIEGHAFVTGLNCVDCGGRSELGLSLDCRLSEQQRTCACGGRMFTPGFFSFEALSRSNLPRPGLDLKLADLGLRRGDVLTISDDAGVAGHAGIGEPVR